MERLGRQWRLLLVCLVLQLACAAILDRTWQLRRNTFAGNPRWTSSKTDLERGVMGAFAFLTRPQALARGHLDLAAWHGFQEILYRESLELEELRASFQLAPGAWLAVVYQKDAEGFSGVRLSARRFLPSLSFRASAIGRFESRVELSHRPLAPGGWHRLRLYRAADGYRLHLDGELVATGLGHGPVRPGRLGFRAGLHPARVDDVVIETRGGEPLRESFDGSARADSRFLPCLGGLLALNLVGAAALGRGPPRRAALSLLLLNGVLVAVAALVHAEQSWAAARYPAIDEILGRREAYWREASARRVRESIRRRYGGPPPAGLRRVLFLGSSQTWGAGARREEDTFVRRVEALLDASSPPGRRYQAINAGISGADSSDLLRIYQREWRGLGAAIVVINLGTNDRDPERLRSNLEQLIRISRADGATPVLVLEPNSPEADTRELRRNHARLAELAEQLSVRLVPMHVYLARRSDEGFLWWDFAHLTSFGQQLFAERLVRELRDLESGGSPAGSPPRTLDGAGSRPRRGATRSPPPRARAVTRRARGPSAVGRRGT